MSPFSIRPPEQHEREHVARLACEIAGWDNIPASMKRSIAEGKCLVAVAEGVVAGYVTFHESFFGRFFIALLGVDPRYRRRGIGSSLMRAAEQLAQSDKIFTSTNQSNVAMQKLLDGLGYRQSGRIENLDEGDPELIYFKHADPNRS